MDNKRSGSEIQPDAINASECMENGFSRTATSGSYISMKECEVPETLRQLEAEQSPSANHFDVPSAALPAAWSSTAYTMLAWGMGVLNLLWLSAFIWAVCGAVNGMDFKNDQAVWRTLPEGPPIAQLHKLQLRSPSPYFQPHALVCPREQVFLADKYRIFELQGGLLDAGSGKNIVTTFTYNGKPCDVNGTIADIAATCNAESCWPVVLIHGSPGLPPQILDCSVVKQYPLLQSETAATRLATRATSEVGHLDRVFTVNGGEVIEYSWSERRGGFAPLWSVASTSDNILAIDVVGDTLFMFHSDGIVESQDLDKGTICGQWALPQSDRDRILGGGCAYEKGSSVLILARDVTDSHGAELLSADLPGLIATSGECKGTTVVDSGQVVDQGIFSKMVRT